MPTTSLKKAADVVIIGGGCNGTSTALHLAKRGVTNVVLVEKNYLTSGATEDSIGNLRPYTSNETTAKILQKSIEIFQNFNEVIGGDPKHIQNGRIWVVSEKRKSMLEDIVAKHQRWGIKAKLISLADLGELIPQANVDGIGAVAYFEEAGNCDPVATTYAYATRARDLGVTIYEETEVTDITVSAGKIQSVVTNRGEVHTPVVVNAAGYWSDSIGRMVGLEIPISATRQQSIFLRRPYDFIGVFPQYHDGISEMAYRPGRPDLQRLIQVYKPIMTLPEVVNPDKYKDEVDDEFLDMALKEARQRMPVLRRASYRGGATGCYDETPDEAPILGAVPEVEGFYCHCGWSGLGFHTSPVIGELMAELITTGKTTLVDLSLFRLSRFKEGKLLESDWYLSEQE
ncbi:MAG: NAD(P)/FAD-dependent oxidoreductase [Dehalococcoidales bacterium]